MWFLEIEQDRQVCQTALRESFPYKISLKEGRILQNIKNWNLFVYVQTISYKCDIEVPESLREVFATIPPTMKKLKVTKNDIEPLIKENPENEQFLNEPARMLISS